MYCYSLIFLSLFTLNVCLGNEKFCRVKITKHLDQPLILNVKNEFFYPKNREILEIEIAIGEKVLIGCPGSLLPQGVEFGYATCVRGSSFEIKNKLIDLNKIVCSGKVKESIQYTGEQCELNGREIEIGYQLPNTFLKLIRVCFDDVEYNPLYSHSVLTSCIGDHEGVNSPNFKQDNFYNIQSVNNLYKRDKQMKTINELLGYTDNNSIYIKNNTEYYFARGHLTPKSDFVYGAQEDATFHLINTAPQWQTFNGGNWEEIEASVRRLAQDRIWNLSVFTGTFGIATLPNVLGVSTPLYLYVEGARKEIPVPAYYWKVITHEETGVAVAIIGINNPFIEDFSPYVFCTNIADELPWLTYHRIHTKKGFIFACEVEEFRRTVQQLPYFKVSGLLK